MGLKVLERAMAAPGLMHTFPLPLAETRGEYTLDLSGELSAALGLIFDNQQGCDLSIQVVGQGQEELALCAHTVILRANPEAEALWEKPGSSIIMRVDSECVFVARDFLR